MPAIVAASNTTVSPLTGGDWRIDKTGGVDNQYDASAVSASSIAGDFALRAIDLSPGNSAVFGVNTDPGTSDGWADIDFAAQFYGEDFYIFESGVQIGTTYAHGGTAWIVREAGQIRYLIGPKLRDATVIRTVSDVWGSLSFDCTIGRMDGAIAVRFDPPGPWSHGTTPRTRLAISIGG